MNEELARQFGGTWEHDSAFGCWNSDDGHSHVAEIDGRFIMFGRGEPFEIENPCITSAVRVHGALCESQERHLDSSPQKGTTDHRGEKQ